MLSSLFSSCVIFVILFHISHSTSVANKQYTCNLLSNSSDQVICNLPISMNNGFKLASSLASVPLAYENGKLIWLNQYQPANLRWTQLCPRPSQYSIYLCSNGAECHQTGTCVLRFVNAMRNEQVQINLIDNVNNTRLDVPKFNDNQLKMIEITMDLLQLSSEESGEQVLIESIGELDPFHSKLVYERIEFSLILMNKTINSSPFFIEKDAKSDKLVLKASRLYFDMLKSNRSALTCLIYELRMRRPGSEVVDSARIQINLKDARLDRPVFDFSVYNFTIVENSPLSTIIGQVNAVFLNAEDESLMKYRIVPFVDDFKMFQSQSESNEIDSLSLASSSLLPIKIDSTTGQLTQRVFVDREKFLNGGEPGSGKLASSDDGVISFNVEVSYASMLYDYCKVNVFVRDVNDNPPLIRIKPLHNFDRPTNNGLKSHYIKNSTAWLSPITNLYVSDQTPASQILAYISVLDQDSGENGTVKAVDLSLLNVKQPSQQLVKQRQLKLQRLRDFEIRSNQSHVASLESPATSQSIHTIPLPVRLNKISNKLYTLQLVEKLNFKHFESYSIEMRVQDNGSRPQLEGKQRIDLNILDYNRHAPIFLNSNNKVELPELSPRQFNATCIFRFDAIDLDDERSGHVKYKIVNNPFLKLLLNTKQLDDRDFNIEATSLLESTFKLNKETGELVLLKPIDRDTLLNDTIELQVMAQDQSEPSQTRKYTTFSLLISIIDSNNQRPRFEGVENNALNLAYSIENNKERFVRLTSDIYLIDSDKSDTNSVRFLEAVSNETNQFLSSPSTQHVSSLIDSKVFKFGDLSCYKSFNIRLTPSTDVNQLPFLVYVTRDTNNSLNNIKCKVSVWLDNQKYPKNETNSEYKLQLTATDNGVDQSYENYDLNKIDIQVSLNNIMPSILKRKVSVQVDLNTKKDKRAYGEIELANMSQSQVDFVKLSACVQLVDVNSELTLVNCSRLFKLLDMRLQYQLDEINEGAYLIDVYRRDENMKLQLVQIELFVYKSMIGLKRARSTALEYELSVINALKSVNNILMQTRSDSIVQESENSIVKAIQNSFSSTLAQFQQLIFGKNPTLQLLSNDGKSASLFTQNESTSTSSSIFSILFTNRSTFMKLVLLTVCFSLAVLILLVCCIFITIQRNNTKSKPKPGVIVNESDKNYSSYNVISLNFISLQQF